MPEIHVPFSPHEEPSGLPAGDFSDILFDVRQPAPEPEVTPEQRRRILFGTDTQGGAPVAGQRPEPVYATRSEVCVFGGWPRKHTVVGRHCPHGMLEGTDGAQAPEEQG